MVKKIGYKKIGEAQTIIGGYGDSRGNWKGWWDFSDIEVLSRVSCKSKGMGGAIIRISIFGILKTHWSKQGEHN